MSKVTTAGQAPSINSFLPYPALNNFSGENVANTRMSQISDEARNSNVEKIRKLDKPPSGALALNTQQVQVARLSGATVLDHLYGQKMPAANIIDGLFGKLSRAEYQQLSRRFIDIAQEAGLKAYKQDSLLTGDSLYVDIPATQQGGRMLTRALARFDKVDDRTGGGAAYQRSIKPLLGALGLDKNTEFMKGLAMEAQALKLPWYIEAMSLVNALLGMVPKGARGVNPNAGLRPSVQTTSPSQSRNGNKSNPGFNPNSGGSRAPVIGANMPKQQTTSSQVTPPVRKTPGASTSTSPATPSSSSIARPSSAIRPPSDASLTSAMRIGVVSSNSRSIENPKRFELYINNLNGQPLTTVARVGITGTVLNDSSLATRTASYRNVGIGNLVSDKYPKLTNEGRHDWHLAFGAPSKVGEVNANSRAFRIGSGETWAQRGQLPGKGGVRMSEFWRADATTEFKAADAAITKMKSFNVDVHASLLDKDVIGPLSQMGFIPKGSALATRLERLEGAIKTRSALSDQVSEADPSQLNTLIPKLNAANSAVDVSLKQFSAQATQLRGELLMESLGSPKTTYELTVRHAAGVRYMHSVEGQTNPVFDAAKFNRILTAVKIEAGPENLISIKWHRELIKTYDRDATFTEAMNQSPAMGDAWSAYKARHGF